MSGDRGWQSVIRTVIFHRTVPVTRVMLRTTMKQDAVSTLNFTVNGLPRTVMTDPDRPLLDVLREELHLTGAKYGCGETQCGACSVLVDGRRVFSCRTVVSKVDGKQVVTIEGLATGEFLHPVQQAFVDEQAFQCGYCTPGMIMTAVALLEANSKPTDAEIVEGMNRNVCRCCSYSNILQAVRSAAGRKGR
jgi:aerobic-type carbon monoxide dehydrogenase small subunit (CoxS/CutS family)